MAAVDDKPHVEAEDRETWRAWLERHHATASGAWLVTWRPGSGMPILAYDAAVEEALCFGWIDSKGGSVDDRRTKLYFTPRKPGSGWSAINKARVERLQADGRLAPAGLAAIERARADGSWTALDAIERLEVPDDLAAALAARPPARMNWDGFSRSSRRAILVWISHAKRPATRAARIAETATLAARSERANERRPGGPAGRT